MDGPARAPQANREVQGAPRPERISLQLEEINRLLGDKANCYRLMTEYGYFLPDFSSKCLTREYLEDVLSGKTWVPLQKDAKMARLLHKVTSGQLIEEVLALKPGTNLKSYDPPDKEWLISVLATLKSDHKYFKIAAREESLGSREIPNGTPFLPTDP
jgi:hypothetical protein